MPAVVSEWSHERLPFVCSVFCDFVSSCKVILGWCLDLDFLLSWEVCWVLQQIKLYFLLSLHCHCHLTFICILFIYFCFLWCDRAGRCISAMTIRSHHSALAFHSALATDLFPHVWTLECTASFHQCGQGFRTLIQAISSQPLGQSFWDF